MSHVNKCECCEEIVELRNRLTYEGAWKRHYEVTIKVAKDLLSTGNVLHVADALKYLRQGYGEPPGKTS